MITATKNGKPEIETFRGDGRVFEEKRRLIVQGVETWASKNPSMKAICEDYSKKGDERKGLRVTVVRSVKKVTTSILSVAWAAGDIDRPRVRARDIYLGFLGEVNRRLAAMKWDEQEAK